MANATILGNTDPYTDRRQRKARDSLVCLAMYELCCLRYGLPCRLETRPVARILGSMRAFCLIRGISSQQPPLYCGKSDS
jgi:hypothetical protein